MEPISELATVIASHLWLLHDLYPNESSLITVLNKNWPAELEQYVVQDWSRLQILLDLTGLPNIGDKSASGTPAQPTRGSDSKPIVTAFKHLTQRGLASAPDEEGIRRSLAAGALEIMAQRMSVVEQQELASGITFSATRQDAGPEAILTERISDSRLLTHEELFQKIANWLLAADIGKLHRFADVFLGNAQFLIEEEITRSAEIVRKSGCRDSQRADAENWLGKSAAEKRNVVLERPKLRELCKTLAVPVPYSIVLSDELDEIARSRLTRLYGERPDPTNPPPSAEARSKSGIPSTLAVPPQQAFNSCLFGLALSGGGIRSATFALGLLQGMADRNILPYIDVLSTVSGGGYIGSWLISWIKRRGSVDAVQQSLRGSASYLNVRPECPQRSPTGFATRKPLPWVTRNSDPHADHVRPVRLLRDYSRYLAPQAGLFSADSWTIAATWLRNTLLNMAVLTLFFGGALLLPRLAIFFLLLLGNITDFNLSSLHLLAAILVAGLPLFFGCLLIRTRNLQTFESGFQKRERMKRKGRVSRGDNDARVVLLILPCILIGAFLELVVLWSSIRIQKQPLLITGGFIIIFAAGTGILGLGMTSPDEGQYNLLPISKQVWRILARPLAFIVSVVSGSLLVFWLYSELGDLVVNSERGLWIAGSVGFALILGLIGTVLIVLIGLFGRDLSEEQREWWSRLGAWLGLVTMGWLAICAICFFMPLWIALLRLKIAAAGIGWLAVTGTGVKIAFSPSSGRDSASRDSNRLSRAVLNIAPAVFIIGVLSAVSFALYWALERLTNTWPLLIRDPAAQQLCCSNLPLTLQRIADSYWQLMYPESLAPLVLMLALAVACLYLASRIDINEFSMHNFYKNRLVRAYLGASRSRAHRLPNAFTGFDLDDDIRLHRFRYSDTTRQSDVTTDCQQSYAGPFPILNTALNITRGEDLGIQERKAESFIFTPLWSGFDFTRRQASVRRTSRSEYAFQQTEHFGDQASGGALLGTAMAISGAAFNANAGFHTSPTLAFLLTVFGVRLGWWAGNPRGSKWTSPSPEIGLLYLVKELTANTSTNENFVLLSDGGHFENMGIYELIRRRCRFIILSDAEEDDKFGLEGIGGAIRKCRDDFGVVIDLNLDALQPADGTRLSKLHYALGTIIYPGEARCGTLVYIKSSVTGDEPVDILEFRKRHSEFPHTSTTNQFFDESHFESYRALGHHVASQVFTYDMPPLPLELGDHVCERLQQLFDQIERNWSIQVGS